MKPNMTNKKVKKRSLSEINQVKNTESNNVGNVKKPNLKKLKTENTEKTEQLQNKVNQTKQKKQVNKLAPSNESPVKQTGTASPKKQQTVEQKLKAKQASRLKRKLERRESDGPDYVPESMTAEELKVKIEELQSRDSLSKTGKRKLGICKKKLKIMEEQNATSDGETIKNKKENKLVKTTKETAKPKQAQNNAGQNKKQGNTSVKVNQNISENDDDDDDDDEDEDEEEEEDNDDEMESSVEDEVEIGENDDDDEDVDDDDDADEDVDDEDENKVDNDDDDDEEEEEEKKEEDNDDDDDDDDDDDEKEEDEQINGKKANAQSEPVDDKPADANEHQDNKERFIVFVGNVSYAATANDIEKHFKTKVSDIVGIRQPTLPGNKPRGFAYVELANKADYDKALSLNQSTLDGRKINVLVNTFKRTEGDGRRNFAQNNRKFDGPRRGGKFGGNQRRFGPMGNRPGQNFWSKRT